MAWSILFHLNILTSIHQETLLIFQNACPLNWDECSSVFNVRFLDQSVAGPAIKRDEVGFSVVVYYNAKDFFLLEIRTDRNQLFFLILLNTRLVRFHKTTALVERIYCNRSDPVIEMRRHGLNHCGTAPYVLYILSGSSHTKCSFNRVPKTLRNLLPLHKSIKIWFEVPHVTPGKALPSFICDLMVVSDRLSSSNNLKLSCWQI